MTGGLFPDPNPTRAIGRTWRSRAAWLGLIVLLAGVVPAAAAGDCDAARLRVLFFQRDFETGAIEGKQMLARSPKARELEAWYVLNLVRAGEESRSDRDQLDAKAVNLPAGVQDQTQSAHHRA